MVPLGVIVPFSSGDQSFVWRENSSSVHDQEIVITRHESELSSWEMASRLPPPHLRAHVLAVTGYREDTPQPLRRREVPSGGITLIISFAHPLRLLDAPGPFRHAGTYTSFVAGLHEGPALIEHGGRQHGIEVNLTPLGAHAFFGVPMHELTNTIVDLDDLIGRSAETLIDQLAEARHWEAQFAVLDHVFAAAIDSGPAASPAVARVWERLCQSSGRDRIGKLADEVGWSRRHLIDRFREQVGMPPKALARVLRFERALDFLRQVHRPPLAEVALSCGYYDQAHLNRDFRALAGVTPTEFLGAQLPDGGGTSGA